jgi:hypothetical protein
MRNSQICPDGVVIDINWKAFEVGMSVFIPAVDLSRLEKQMQTVSKMQNMTLKGAERIENRKLGMRFWRIL